ncbi:MAG: HIT family protein [Phycisphaerae bacterium]
MADRPATDDPQGEVPGEASGAQGGCPFCRPELRASALASHGTVFAVPDARPVSEGHALVITLRHTPDFFTMTPDEHRDANELLEILRDRALREDARITGFNVGSNCGESAGQRVRHAHIHFIPRRASDGPAGRGVKGVIRNKIEY